MNRAAAAAHGIIFQAYNLIPFLTTVENVALVLTLNGISQHDALGRAHALLQRLDLGHRSDIYPATLSGGEQQRVAIARAVINDPAVILADEPTAALEPKGKAVMVPHPGAPPRGGDCGDPDERMIEGSTAYHMIGTLQSLIR
jgi:putative ABC transport system ATP-binding protein